MYGVLPTFPILPDSVWHRLCLVPCIGAIHQRRRDTAGSPLLPFLPLSAKREEESVDINDRVIMKIAARSLCVHTYTSQQTGRKVDTFWKNREETNPEMVFAMNSPSLAHYTPFSLSAVSPL